MKRENEGKPRMDKYPNILLQSKNWNTPIDRSVQQCGNAGNLYKEFTWIVLDKMFRTLCVYDAGQNTWLVFLEITQIGCFVRPLKKHSRDISSK